MLVIGNCHKLLIRFRPARDAWASLAGNRVHRLDHQLRLQLLNVMAAVCCGDKRAFRRSARQVLLHLVPYGFRQCPVLNHSGGLKEMPSQVPSSKQKALRCHQLLILPVWILPWRIGLAQGKTPNPFFMQGVDENNPGYLAVVSCIERSRM